jgi:hypothetical protein
MSDQLSESVRYSAAMDASGIGSHRLPALLTVRPVGLPWSKSTSPILVVCRRTPQRPDDRTRWLTNSRISGFNVG